MLTSPSALHQVEQDVQQKTEGNNRSLYLLAQQCSQIPQRAGRGPSNHLSNRSLPRIQRNTSNNLQSSHMSIGLALRLHQAVDIHLLCSHLQVRFVGWL